MLEGKGYSTLDIVPPSVGSFINYSTGNERALPMTRFHTHCSGTVVEFTKDISQSSWREQEVGSFGRRVAELKRLLTRTIHEHCDCGLYPQKYHSLDDMVKDIGICGALFA